MPAGAENQWTLKRLSEIGNIDPFLLHTLQIWLGNNGYPSSIVGSLGLSIPATRNRILRIEQVLRRSLLNAPSAPHERQLALRISDRHRR